MDPTLYAWKGTDGNVYARSSNYDGVRTLGTAGATNNTGGTAVLHPNGTTTYIQLQADPNAQAPAAATSDASSYGGYGSLSEQQAAENAKLSIQQGLSSANDAVGRLDNQAKIGDENINRDYEGAIQQLTGQKTIAQRDYSTSRTGQVNEYIGKKEANNNDARSYLLGVRRKLGAEGAGGGSAARYNAPHEAQVMNTSANASAQGTNNKNLIALDTNWADTQDKFKNAESDAGRQKEQGHNDLLSKIANQRATLLNTIAQLTGQLNIANGGDYKSALAASQAYSGQIPGILNQIDALAATPKITPMAVTANAPSLEGYNYARPGAPVVAPQDSSLPTNSPVYAALFGVNPQDQDKQQQLVPAIA
jgi:hypothetical protein